MPVGSGVAYAPMVAGRHEIWARVAWAAVDLSRELGVTADSLLVELPYDAAELRRRKRVAWADYCAIVERIGEAAGGMTELEDLLADSYHHVVPELRSLASVLIPPRAFVRFVIDVLDPVLFPPLEMVYEELDDDRLRIGALLRPGARPCEAYFRGSIGALRGLTAHLDLPMSELSNIDVGPDRSICDVRLPASRTLVSRARRLVVRFVLGVERDGTDVAATLGAPDGDPTEQRLDHATRTWKLTPRQADVLARVVAGQTNKQIAAELGCADNTIELHVTRLLRKADVTSRSQLIARFWSAAWGFPH